MRSLFLRIFVSFWLIQSGFWIMYVVMTPSHAPGVITSFDARIRASVLTASRLAILQYKIGGPRFYMRSVGDFEHESNIQLWIVGPDGNELAGRTIPAETLRRTHRTDLALAIPTNVGMFSAYAEVPESLLPPSNTGRTIRLIIGILVSGIVCYLLSLYLTRPLDNLRVTAQRMASGDLSARASAPRSRDHIWHLVDDFNRMAERLQATIDAQRQMVSDISHELRSPLARLTVALDLARARAGKEAAGSLDRIELESSRLNEMIGRILSLAQLSYGDLHMRKARVEIAGLLQDLTADSDYEARARETAVALHIAPAAAHVSLDCYPSLLRSAIENIVRNAIAYTPAGTKVEIDLTADETLATVRVRDHGPGVPEAELSKLFLPFYRVDDSRARKTGGTGLGLSIAARAIALHGGSIVASNAPDHGMVMTIELPIQVPSTAPPVASGALQNA